jgi:hypothetical protein
MTEPLETDFFEIPRQVAGQGSRTRMNAALDRIDAVLGGLGAQMAAIDNAGVRVKIHPPQVMVGGETLVTLIEPFQEGARRLDVERGGLKHAQNLHWVEIDSDKILFLTPCLPGEVVSVTEYQLGRDAGALPPLPAGPTYEVTETPLGVIDSTNGVNGNGTFTLQHNIAAGTTPGVQISGFLNLTPGSHFTWTDETNEIVILSGYKPSIGESLTVTYSWHY